MHTQAKDDDEGTTPLYCVSAEKDNPSIFCICRKGQLLLVLYISFSIKGEKPGSLTPLEKPMFWNWSCTTWLSCQNTAYDLSHTTEYTPRILMAEGGTALLLISGFATLFYIFMNF